MPAIPLIREAFPGLYSVANWARVSDIALSFAQAGVHCVAPSDMNDGRIRAIKLKLFQHRLESKVAIMSYSAKYASCLYGPFREAASSAPAFGDRKHYLLPPPARTLGRKAMLRDMQEGTDIIIVKPTYPDILSDAKNVSTVPVVAIQASGEFAMIHAAARAGVFN
ncbi:delta-aminolevulinic acid dehydratase [Aspergillus pseudocaelatus]|uniref:porphobilinogen synthase n=1 Tax=Aspergillus pseudocaelatus TaxID=1825620 RepID=A0ABQ6X0I6_9EURO|nr:delta-aminolevulinic acid dehydratase [Aspergillus pseudocaelatus]